MAPEQDGLRVVAKSTGDAFGVKRVVFPIGAMSGAARRLLRKRLRSELDAVRDAIRKAELFPGTGPAGPQAAAPMEIDDSREAKRRKVSSSAPRTEKQKRTTAEERERLAGRLASLAAALPDHVVAFLQDQRAADADFRGDGGEAEMNVSSMKDGALFQLKLLLDKFAPASTPKIHGHAAALDATGVSCLSQDHPSDANGKIVPVEKEGDVGISGGASRRLKLRDVAEEYGELVAAVGVPLLSPLPPKHVDLAERCDEEYIDICGDASPVVFPAANEAVEPGGSPSSSSSGSSVSSSDSESGRDSDRNDGVPPSPPVFRKEDCTDSEQAAQPPKPAPEKVQIPEPEAIQNQSAAPSPSACPITRSPTAPLVVPMNGAISIQLPESAPEEAVQIAKPEKLKTQCAVTTPTVRPIISSSPPVPLSLPKGNGTSAPPPEAAHSLEPEELQNQRIAVIAPTVPSTATNPAAPPALPNGNVTSAQPSPPPPAPRAARIAIVGPENLQNQHTAVTAPTVVPSIATNPAAPAALPNGNVTSAQPSPTPPAPDAARITIVGPEKLQNQRTAVTAPTVVPSIATNPAAPAGLPNGNETSAHPSPTPPPDAARIASVEPEDPQAPTPADPLADLIAKAQELAERRRREERNRAREQARRELLEMERAALPDERVHPLDMELLGIATFEHVVSTTVEGTRTARAARGSGRAAPVCPTALQFLGLFLKADDGSEEELEQRPGVAPGGAGVDMEEGEIR